MRPVKDVMPVQNMQQLSTKARFFMKMVPEVCDFSLDEMMYVRVFPIAPANTTDAVIALSTSSMSSKSEVVSTTDTVVSFPF